MKRTRERHVEGGREILDPTPMSPPVGYKRQPTLSEQVRQMVVLERIRALQEMEETEEEADDFEIEDGFEPISKYENEHMPSIRELKRRANEINEQIERAKLEKLKNRLEDEIGKKRAPKAPASKTSGDVSDEAPV